MIKLIVTSAMDRDTERFFIYGLDEGTPRVGSDGPLSEAELRTRLQEWAVEEVDTESLIQHARAHRATRFERQHTNGWVATVDATPEGFTASAHERGAAEAKWVLQQIEDLATAQEEADARVPGHVCACPAWLPREPALA